MPGRDCLQGTKRLLVQSTGLGDRDLLEWPSRRVLVFLVLLGVTAAIVLTMRSDPQSGLPRIQGAGPDRGAVARPVTLRGMVDEAMYRRVVEAVSGGARHFTVDSSLGGLPLYAGLIATTIAANDGSLTADGICYSACALMLIGVKNKFYTADADIQVHGARYKYPAAGQDPDAPARETVRFLLFQGVPPDLANKWGMAINFHKLTPDELALIGVTYRRHVGS